MIFCYTVKIIVSITQQLFALLVKSLVYSLPVNPVAFHIPYKFKQ